MHGTRSHVPELRNIEPQLRKIGIADQRPDRRHQDVVHQRRDDFAECTADDHTDGHVHHIPLEGELLEFF
jgi:hypothetical protein